MTFEITEAHFLKAAKEIGKSGDNDTLPYDQDARFVKERSEQIAAICFGLYNHVLTLPDESAVKGYITSAELFSERLLAPAGAHGFRIITKIHPLWNVYLNGLALAIADHIAPRRSNRAFSYWPTSEVDRFFNGEKTWRKYKEATVERLGDEQEKVVVQTDISSFYERIYHHRLENILAEYIGGDERVSTQIDRMLAKMSSGRSFGLPVGGQCSRVLAEAMMLPIDEALTQAGIDWLRYVDDFTLMCDDHQDAYKALSTLSHALADYGLSLNRTKTTILSARHYKEYVAAQLGDGVDQFSALRELDLYFDPYSDNAITEYRNLQETVSTIDFELLLNLEKQKSQPDGFVVAQISRALQYQEPETALSLTSTLLDDRNLDSFRASWAKIMRGVYAVRSNLEFEIVFDAIDERLDALPQSVAHLLLPEANCLHFLRALRFKKTDPRARFVRQLFEQTASVTVKAACIDCWQYWGDMPNFTRLRNQWATLGPEVQRMFWLAASRFGDDGQHARQQLRRAALRSWELGVEREGAKTFAETYIDWAGSA